MPSSNVIEFTTYIGLFEVAIGSNASVSTLVELSSVDISCALHRISTPVDPLQQGERLNYLLSYIIAL